jgi:hypothetical protein
VPFPYTTLVELENPTEVVNILREMGSTVNPPMGGICIPRKGDFQGVLPTTRRNKKNYHVFRTLLEVQVKAMLS